MYIHTYIYKVSYIHSFLCYFQLYGLFLHCMLNILRYEKTFSEIDESITSKHDLSSDVIFLGVYSESIFPFMEYLFLKKTAFPFVSLSLAYC